MQKLEQALGFFFFIPPYPQTSPRHCVGGFVMGKGIGEAGRQGGNGVMLIKRGGDYGCKADR